MQSSRRSNLAKAPKDIDQAAALIEAFLVAGRRADLSDAFEEAAARGPSWSSAVRAGLARLPDRLSPAAKQILQGIAHDQ